MGHDDDDRYIVAVIFVVAIVSLLAFSTFFFILLPYSHSFRFAIEQTFLFAYFSKSYSRRVYMRSHIRVRLCSLCAPVVRLFPFSV